MRLFIDCCNFWCSVYGFLVLLLLVMLNGVSVVCEVFVVWVLEILGCLVRLLM